MSKTLESRLAALEGTGKPKTLYEMTDRELLIATGLTGDEAPEVIEAHLQKIIAQHNPRGEHGGKP